MTLVSRKKPNQKVAHIVSFGDSRLIKAASRFQRQARRFRCFQSVKVYAEESLEPAFWENHRIRIDPKTRGFGYWMWKPKIILQRLAELPEGSLLFYADIGFHINARGRNRFNAWVDSFEASQESVLVFQAHTPEGFIDYDGRPLPDLRDGIWCKGDLIRFLSMEDDPELWTPTIGAGLVGFKNSGPARALLTSWLQIAEEQYPLLDDSPSVVPNPVGFCEHRHDQSVFSLLTKKARLGLRLSAYEYWYPNRSGRGADWKTLRSQPFLAKRDLGHSRLRSVSDRIRRLIRSFS